MDKVRNITVYYLYVFIKKTHFFLKAFKAMRFIAKTSQ